MRGMSTDPIVVEVIRGDVAESAHEVDVAVVAGDEVRAAGDADRVAFFRSSLKPIQAAVCLDEGWAPSSEESVAVASASHNAEPEHLAAVRAVLHAAGLDEAALQCTPAFPLRAQEAARAGAPARLLSDCSGKHAAMLATCVARGWPLDTYMDPAHPLQQAIAERVGALAGPVEARATDGCGVPTFAVPLERIARGFLHGVARSPRVAAAMRAHPFLVAGTERICTDVMRAAGSDVVLKAGAEGILCFASAARSLGGAIKARDGASRATPPVAVAVLVRLGLLSEPVSDVLARHASPPVPGGGRPVGRLALRAIPAL